MTSRRLNNPSRLIVGCGYLGQRVARRWIQSGSTVFAITRSPENAEMLSAENIHPIIGDVTAADGSPKSLRDLPEVDTVLWSVGFDRSADASYHDVHVTGLLHILEKIPNTPRVIFISSTGIWGNETADDVDESTPACPTREAGRVLLEAEAALEKHPKGPGVALRLAGIYGPDRLPRVTDIVENKPIPANPESWLNLIHVDDAASVICDITEVPSPESLYVVSDTTPIRRKDWYSSLAQLTNSPPPRWAAEATRLRGGNKRVNSSRIWNAIQKRPDHPNAIDAMRTLLRESS
ncbi:MAG: SDR family oxidoreductase [Pirellulales bacterium]